MSDDTTEQQQSAAETPAETEQPQPRLEFAVVVRDEVTGEWGEPIGEIDGTMNDAFAVAGTVGGEVVAREVGPWGIVRLQHTIPDDASSLLGDEPASTEA